MKCKHEGCQEGNFCFGHNDETDWYDWGACPCCDGSNWEDCPSCSTSPSVLPKVDKTNDAKVLDIS